MIADNVASSQMAALTKKIDVSDFPAKNVLLETHQPTTNSVLQSAILMIDFQAYQNSHQVRHPSKSD